MIVKWKNTNISPLFLELNYFQTPLKRGRARKTETRTWNGVKNKREKIRMGKYRGFVVVILLRVRSVHV